MKNFFSPRKYSILLAALLLGIYGPALFAHMSYATLPFFYNDDVLQQIWPFYSDENGPLFAHDMIAQYYLDCYPLGYKALFTIGSSWLTPQTLSKVLPYPLLGVILVGLVMAGRRMGGSLGGWFALAVGLASSIWLARMTGGLPRAFAYPLIAMMVAGLICSRPLLLAVTIVIAALFYPVAAVFGGILLVFYLLVLPEGDRELSAKWTLARRVGLVAITGLLCLAAVVPVLQKTKQYGPQIAGATQKDFPELGPGGRYLLSDRPPYPSYMAMVKRFKHKLYGRGYRPWPYITEWVLAAKTSRHTVIAVFFGGMMTLLVVIGMVRKGGKWRRLGLLLFVSILLHSLAKLVTPSLYIPARYAEYVLPFFFALAIPGGAMMLGEWFGRRLGKPSAGSVLSVGLCVACLVLLMPRGSSDAGFTVKSLETLPIFDAVAELPTSSVIAGWPRGVVNHVPYLTGRSVLITYEVHQVFHKAYALEMRRRMKAVTEAIFAHDFQPIQTLRDDFGVTHLILDMRQFEKCPIYFKPFNKDVKRAFAQAERGRFFREQVPQSAVVYSDARRVLIDIQVFLDSRNSLSFSN